MQINSLSDNPKDRVKQSKVASAAKTPPPAPKPSGPRYRYFYSTPTMVTLRMRDLQIPEKARTPNYDSEQFVDLPCADIFGGPAPKIRLARLAELAPDCVTAKDLPDEPVKVCSARLALAYVLTENREVIEEPPAPAMPEFGPPEPKAKTAEPAPGEAESAADDVKAEPDAEKPQATSGEPTVPEKAPPEKITPEKATPGKIAAERVVSAEKETGKKATAEPPPPAAPPVTGKTPEPAPTVKEPASAKSDVPSAPPTTEAQTSEKPPAAGESTASLSEEAKEKAAAPEAHRPAPEPKKPFSLFPLFRRKEPRDNTPSTPAPRSRVEIPPPKRPAPPSASSTPASEKPAPETPPAETKAVKPTIPPPRFEPKTPAVPAASSVSQTPDQPRETRTTPSPENPTATPPVSESPKPPILPTLPVLTPKAAPKLVERIRAAEAAIKKIPPSETAPRDQRKPEAPAQPAPPPAPGAAAPPPPKPETVPAARPEPQPAPQAGGSPPPAAQVAPDTQAKPDVQAPTGVPTQPDVQTVPDAPAPVSPTTETPVPEAEKPAPAPAPTAGPAPETVAAPAELVETEHLAPKDVPPEIVDQDGLQAIFHTEEQLSVPRVLELCGGLPGIHSCVLSHRSDVIAAHNTPDSVDIVSLSAHALEMLNAMRTSSAKMGIGAIPAVTVHSEKGPITFFHRDDLCLLVFHKDRGFVPGVREKLQFVMDELSKAKLPLRLGEGPGKKPPARSK